MVHNPIEKETKRKIVRNYWRKGWKSSNSYMSVPEKHWGHAATLLLGSGNYRKDLSMGVKNPQQCVKLCMQPASDKQVVYLSLFPFFLSDPRIPSWFLMEILVKIIQSPL